MFQDLLKINLVLGMNERVTRAFQGLQKGGKHVLQGVQRLS